MACYDARRCEIQSGQLGALGGDVLVAGAVESVFADAVTLVIFVRYGIHVVDGRYRVVERGVEDGHLRYARQHAPDREYALHVGGVVERRYGEQLLYPVFYLLVDDAAVGEVLAAVSHAVAYGRQLVERCYHAVPGIGQRIQHQTDAGGVVCDRQMLFERSLAGGLVCQIAFGHADALDQTLGQQLVFVAAQVEYLILDRRAAAVENQYNHFRKVFSITVRPRKRRFA